MIKFLLNLLKYTAIFVLVSFILCGLFLDKALFKDMKADLTEVIGLSKIMPENTENSSSKSSINKAESRSESNSEDSP